MYFSKIFLKHQTFEKLDAHRDKTKRYIFRKVQNILFMFSVCLPLRKPDNEGRLIIIARGTQHDPKKFSLSDVMKVKIKIV